MYEHGLSVDKNYKKAARIYNKAAKKGYAYVQFKLGLLYAKGHGIKQSNVKAYAWLFAANQNLLNRPSKENKTSKEIGEINGNVFAAIHVDLITQELEAIAINILPEKIDETNRLAQKYVQYQ